jgi:hypothetical protein
MRFAFDHTHTNCPQCGAILGNVFAAKTTVKPVSKLGPSLKEIGRHSARIGGITLGAITAGAIAASILVFVLTPIFGGNARLWIFAAAYFGGLIGLFVGLLWSLLGYVENYLMWGLFGGVATGALSGVVNFYVLNRGGYLPEVKLYEHAIVGVIAGAVAGLFIGVYKDRD